MEYHKIQSIYKRYEKGHPQKGEFIIGEWSIPEIGYLANNIWLWTEKIDGTNIRIYWENGKIRIEGRHENSQIPAKLYNYIVNKYTPQLFKSTFEEGINVTLYGEGYGANIQKGGGNYISDGVSFILFDIMIDGWWLLRHNIEDIGNKLDTKVVSLIGKGTIHEAIELVKKGFVSEISEKRNFIAEGLVLKPEVEMFSRKGERIVAKIKYKDFKTQ